MRNTISEEDFISVNNEENFDFMAYGILCITPRFIVIVVGIVWIVCLSIKLISLLLS
jgi:hypothetical protein